MWSAGVGVIQIQIETGSGRRGQMNVWRRTR